MPEKKSARSFLLRLFFPLIYLAFFVVQLFINFDTGLIQVSDRYQLVMSRSLDNHAFFLNGKNTDPKKTKFRLNKRFQPAIFGLLTEIEFQPTAPVVSGKSLQYLDPDLSDALHRTLLLRGPPPHRLNLF